MADIDAPAPNGSIEIEINLASTKDGNKALAEAQQQAVAQAKAQGRQITGKYGTRRDGDALVVIFPLNAKA